MSRMAAVAMFVGGALLVAGATLASLAAGLFTAGAFVVWVAAWALREEGPQ